MSGIVDTTCLVSRIGALNFFDIVPTTMRLNTGIPGEFSRSSDKSTRGQNVAPMGSDERPKTVVGNRVKLVGSFRCGFAAQLPCFSTQHVPR